MRMHHVALAALAIVATSSGCLAKPHGPSPATTSRTVKSDDLPAYQDPTAPLQSRVDDLFSRLTEDEKLSLLTGTGFTTQPIPRLNIPAVGMCDAGQGVRGGTQGTQGPATLFPTEVVMARSWNTDLISQIGRGIGEELLNKGEGAQILLGPDVNIHRSPLGGRDAESFTEDPYLNAQLAVNYITGMQSSGALACIKHYACNNEEQDRNTVDVRVDERALREIYLPAFKAGITQGHCATIMAAYNKIDGPYATANAYLLRDVLKGQWGFDGIVMSDWGAVHDTVKAVTGGCDLEMPGGDYMTAPKLQDALSNSLITQDQIDDSVKRILRTVIRTGLLDAGSVHTPDHSVVNSPAHQKLAYDAACEGIVLLKNDNATLPLDTSRIKSIAVIGPAAVDMQAGALGSPNVQPFYTISPLDGINKAAGQNINVQYVEGVTLPSPSPDAVPSDVLTAPDGNPGLLGEYFTTPDLSGQPAASRVDQKMTFFRGFHPPSTPSPVRSARWTGTLTPPRSGLYTLAVLTDAGARLIVDGKTVIDESAQGGNWMHTAKVPLEAGHAYHVVMEILDIKERLRGRFGWVLPEVDNIDDAVAAAAKADVAVVVVSTGGQEGEGNDRPSMALPGAQDRLIDAVVKANPHTIVVLNAGSPVLMPWLSQVSALVDMGFPGEEGGHALADILFGTVDPSGKLTDTVGARREDYPDFGNFPGKHGKVRYAEGIYVGYRHFDKKAITPVFPFGYGLSYTTFHYANLKLSSPTLDTSGTVTASVDITNSGSRAGAEVVQLYVAPPSTSNVDRPVRELKGFSKVNLAPGETKTVNLALSPADFAYYDARGKQWVADTGTYTIEVGASSRDIRQQCSVTLTDKWTAQP